MSDLESKIPDLDPDDPRPASQQIANRLRAAILARTFEPGTKLPSQLELAERYGVARETVKSALRALTTERLIVTRQGSGAFVRARTERPVGLRPHVDAAFAEGDVSIDFAGFSGETLQGLLQEPLDKIRAGQLTPSSLQVRVLLPDMTAPAGVPARASDGADDPKLRQRAARIAHRSIDAIVASIEELAELELVDSADVTVKAHRAAPLFKLYLLNGRDAFFGFYPVVRHEISLQGTRIEMFDVLGKDVPLLHFAATDEDAPEGALFVEQALSWFDSVWSTISQEYPV